MRVTSPHRRTLGRALVRRDFVTFFFFFLFLLFVYISVSLSVLFICLSIPVYLSVYRSVHLPHLPHTPHSLPVSLYPPLLTALHLPLTKPADTNLHCRFCKTACSDVAPVFDGIVVCHCLFVVIFVLDVRLSSSSSSLFYPLVSILSFLPLTSLQVHSFSLSNIPIPSFIPPSFLPYKEKSINSKKNNNV